MRIILSVTNDIATDQRMARIAVSLKKLPAEVLITGTSNLESLPLLELPFSCHRFKMLFKKGPLFYMEFNTRLFFYLLFKKYDILVANDLDTLPANYLVSKLRRKPLVYDSHEYFTELPELVDRKSVKSIWQFLEAFMLPHIRHAYTVSTSIAVAYNRKYGISMEVIRNVPLRIKQPDHSMKQKKKDFLIIYQGSLNMGRGLELAIRSVQYLTNTRLIIAGSGYLANELRELSHSLDLQDKIQFTGRLLPEELLRHTLMADLGISLEENKGLNYYYALPNKVFDYIQAGIPVLVSGLPEMERLVTQYGVGKVTGTDDPRELAGIIMNMLADERQRKEWHDNLLKAAEELCWENEEFKLLNLYRQVKL